MRQGRRDDYNPAMSSANRQLAAIVIAHTVGAHERSGELLQDIFRPYLKQYNGRLLKAGEILGIEVLDHIIIANSQFLSFKESFMSILRW